MCGIPAGAAFGVFARLLASICTVSDRLAQDFGDDDLNQSSGVIMATSNAAVAIEQGRGHALAGVNAVNPASQTGAVSWGGPS